MRTKFILTAGMMLAALAAGYLCRRKHWLREELGEAIMTWVAVLGYPAVGFLSVWATPLKPSDALLPMLAIAHTALMTWIALLISRLLTRDRQEQGLFAITGGLGNNGFTMGAFVAYLLYGELGMGVANLYFLFFVIPVVLLMYPIARHHAAQQPGGSLVRLIWNSLLDWRSIGLPITLVAVALSAAGVNRPEILGRLHAVEVLAYTLTPLTFFAIGLRLHGSKVLPLWRLLAGLAVVRFVIGAAVALVIARLADLTPWAFRDLRSHVYLLEGFVPTAVTAVAVANMFDLRPQEASVLFVVNTIMYLVFVLPIVWVLFRGL